MSDQVFAPGPTEMTVRGRDGAVVSPPQGWQLLPPGDAALTRRVKAAGPFWLVQEKKGRRSFSRGVWAPAETIRQIRIDLQQERSTEQFARKRHAEVARRERVQQSYVEDFTAAVIDYLAFDLKYDGLARKLADRVAAHATPVGSGTVARTKRISVADRAEAAVIAWMRHQTTGYDDMVIPRVRGKRREVRRMLARRSVELLSRYRRGDSVPPECPLRAALEGDRTVPISERGAVMTGARS